MQFGIELKNFKWSPAQLRYPQWAGLYSKGNKHVYVNRGLGHIGYAGRIGIYPEISILKIYNKA
jgi:predicted MPP superfamily phosphohydrolase